MRSDLARAIKTRVAIIAVGPSTARGQGTSGVVAALRTALDRVHLEKFATARQKRFAAALESSTERVRAALPRPARSWGLARKCLNIFLRDCFYNRFLCEAHDLGVAEAWFEVPLDRAVADGLNANSGSGLPTWPGVKRLTPDISALYQYEASSLSRTRGISRVHLDTFLWVANR